LVNIFNKMGVGSRTEAVMRALNQGWVEMAATSDGAAGIEEPRTRDYGRGA
jgi:hypothetical protein